MISRWRGGILNRRRVCEIGGWFYELDRDKLHRKRSNKVKRGFLYIGRWGLMHRKGSNGFRNGLKKQIRVLTKFQVNLVIPKALFMVIFQPKEGICI